MCDRFINSTWWVAVMGLIAGTGSAALAMGYCGMFELLGGRFQQGGKYGRSVLAHRFCYETLVRPLAPGEVLHHLCENPRCVCPDHLEPMTQAEHLARSERVRARWSIWGGNARWHPDRLPSITEGKGTQ